MSFSEAFEKAWDYLEKFPDQQLSFHIENIPDFECKQCAQCCTKPWRIDVTQTYVDEWEDRLIKEDPSRFSGVFIPYKENPPPGAIAHIRKHPDNSCIFLEDNNLCYLQKQHSHHALPLICQNYPRIKTQGGQGEYELKSLHSSCSKAADMLSEELNFTYKFQPRPINLPSHTKLLDENRPLSEEKSLAMLGLHLDLMSHYNIPSLQSLQTLLIESLDAFQNQNKPVNWARNIGKQPAAWIQRHQYNHKNNSLDRPLLLQVWNDFVPLKNAELQRYFHLWIGRKKQMSPPIMSSEKAEIYQILRHLWVRKISVSEFLTYHQFTLFQAYLLHMLSLFVIQMWIQAEYFFHQKTRHFPSLINRVETAYSHHLPSLKKVRSLPTEDALVLLRILNKAVFF